MTLSRRAFQRRLLQSASALLVSPAFDSHAAAPAVLPSGRPQTDWGIASGDVTASRAVIWSRTDRPARMRVEWSARGDFTDARPARTVRATSATDFTAKTELTGLPPGVPVAYRVCFEAGRGERSPWLVGRLRTASIEPREVCLAWGGDTCGQGFGIDPARGGLLTYRSILAEQPDLFVHSGDMIYADNPLPATLRLADGTDWRNVVTPEKAKVAETLDEFRGNFRYSLLDAHVRDCLAEVPFGVQWDDHEVRNNWYPGQRLDDDDRYTEKDVTTLAARARQAFLEYNPIRESSRSRIYRRVPYGPLCELFYLDLRSYREPNSTNLQRPGEPGSALLGSQQLRWLEKALRSSRARWKILCCDMPLGLAVGDSGGRWEAVANGDPGAPLGRELEIARLLRSLREHRVRNLIWITADVHYAAAHRYEPERAAFTDFDPFWEFVSGPLHAGTFGPGVLDPTFGPRVVWSSRSPGAPQNLPPSAQQQFFGTLRIDSRTGVVTVRQHDRVGTRLWSTELEPA